MSREKVKEMMTTKLEVNIGFIEDAPVYKADTTLLKATKAVIVKKGTKGGKSTVDLQCEDQDGNKFVMMATAQIIKSLSLVIGVDQ